jgi:FKBP-type peptidyl-prolyl cis-trans isomerase (trigger factor)
MASQSLAEQHQYLQQMGVSLDLVKDKSDEFAEAAKKSAVAEMRKFFILDAICTKENIGVDDDDVDQELVRMARQRGMKASDLYDKLMESGQIKDVEHGIKTRKAVEFLVENADIKIVPRKPVEEVKHDHAAHAPKEEHGHEHSPDVPAGEHGHEHGQK